MQFMKDKREFPTYVHKVIYLNALRQTPIERSLASTDGVDHKLVRSCQEYYNFVMDMHSDMYENPSAWGMDPGEYDEFLGNRKENGMKQKQPSKTKVLRSKARNCIQPYQHLLLSLGKIGRLVNSALILSNEEYYGIKKYYDVRLNPKLKNTFILVPYQVRLNAFQRIGLIITESDNGVTIISKRYPNMLQAMIELAKSSVDVETFGEHNFHHTDFRQIFYRYTPQYVDVVQPLIDSQRDIIDLVHALAPELGLTSDCSTYWKINYHYKGVHVMCIDTDDRFEHRSKLVNTVRIRINGAMSELQIYLDKIREQGDELVKYFMRHLSYCTACSTTHLGLKCEVFGRNVRVCGGPTFQIINPSESDIEYIRKFIELRKEMIELEKNKKKSLLKCENKNNNLIKSRRSGELKPYQYFTTINTTDWQNNPYVPSSVGKIELHKNAFDKEISCWYIDSRKGKWTTLSGGIQFIKKGEIAVLDFWVKLETDRYVTLQVDIFQETWEKRITYDLFKSRSCILASIGDYNLYSVSFTAFTDGSLYYGLSVNNAVAIIAPSAENDFLRAQPSDN